MKIKKVIMIVGVSILVLFLIWLEYKYLPNGIDWTKWYRPATLELLAGRSPYTVEGFFNPPWTLIPFIPLALLPERFSNIILVNIGLLCFIFILYRLKIRPLYALVFIFFPTTLSVLHTMNIEWLVMLGFLLPPQIGLFFVLIKPQVGISMAIYWLIVCPNKLKTFLPVICAYLISFIVYGFWISKLIVRGTKTGYYGTYDISFFPYLVPLGLAFLILAIIKRKTGFAYMASPFLSPYVGAPSYSVVLLGLFKLLSDHYHGLPKAKAEGKLQGDVSHEITSVQ